MKKESAFKMKGFSGFGNSPVESNITTGSSKKPEISKIKQGLKNISVNLTKSGAGDKNTLPLGPNKPNTIKSEIKQAFKNFKNPTRGGVPAYQSKIAKAGNVLGKVARAGGKLASGFGVGMLLKDFYDSGQKHSGGKIRKDQKSIWSGKKTKVNINKGFNFNKK